MHDQANNNFYNYGIKLTDFSFSAVTIAETSASHFQFMNFYPICQYFSTVQYGGHSSVWSAHMQRHFLFGASLSQY